ncbi:GNAT family N-acetyltransferase [Dokdonella sp.]|uniref:GNAT family N-acetyltransferase n=1 Tax=Dokdonella sp. TaxID=2291710 RepID=UPI0031C7A824|nr:N-acetyltransferase [Dokdonella sp.]
MALDILHNRGEGCFEASLDDTRCALEYTLAEGGMAITRILVPASHAERAVLDELMHTALDYARARRWKVVSLDSAAEAWLAGHPEYADLQV